MMLRRFAALGAVALAIGMPAVASAAPASPVLLAMASFAGETGGPDAANQASLKKAHYKAHAAAHAKGDCKDCPDCADCADCDKAKPVVTAAEKAAGICDPTKHGIAKKAGKAGA
ncbi:hypothetical protein ACU5AX_20035 [Sphingomonas sp. XXL09]|uniref:hypothetical protein n=1 Tax=Sphingomonas TaxID=13687 RepID=UPI001F5983D0|nr:hypothetical protein [Sphingomonas sp. JXJ CY 53]